MASNIEDAAAALDSLSTAILAITTDDRRFDQIWGWNQPTITRHDLARLPSKLAKRLRGLNPTSLGMKLDALLATVRPTADNIRTQSLPNFGGHAFYIVQQVREFTSAISDRLPTPPPPKTAIDWKEVASKGQLPPELLRRLRSVEASLKAIEPRTATVADQVAAIDAAHAAAESLPTDLQSLQEARATIDEAAQAVTEASGVVESNADAAENALADIRSKQEEAAKVLVNIGNAYRITTTKGLAASFAQKSFWLNVSLAAWVAGLLGALYLGASFASERFAKVEALINQNVTPDRLWINLVIALVGVGAPIWFAWVATKQIGQRFRLAEDYGFKASVAKAYEGYRAEAARIDPEFEARLFASALTRLEEAPLRHVEPQSFGSPFHELTSSAGFQKALQAIPELKSTFSSLLARHNGSAAGAAATVLTAVPDENGQR